MVNIFEGGSEPKLGASRRLAPQAVREQRGKTTSDMQAPFGWSSLLDGLAEGIVITNQDGAVIYHNRAFSRLLAPSALPANQDLAPIVLPPDRELLYKLLHSRSGEADLRLDGDPPTGVHVVTSPLGGNLVAFRIDGGRDPRAELALDERILIDTLPFAVLVLDMLRRRIRLNDAAAALLDMPREVHWRRMARLRFIAGGNRMGLRENPLYAAMRTKAPLPNMEMEIIRDDRARLYVLVGASPLLASDGRVRGAVAIAADTSSRKDAEFRQQMLMAELDHRVKNILSVVQSLAQQTLVHSSTLAQFGEAFQGRLAALSRSHQMLVRNRWQGLSLPDLVHEALEGFIDTASPRVSLSGPRLMLTPAAAQSFYLVLHELATNANKYGALSLADGRLKVHWKLQDREKVVAFAWEEAGDRLLEAPGKLGFGTTLIQRVVTHELRGRSAFEYRACGLRCLISFPARPSVTAAVE